MRKKDPKESSRSKQLIRSRKKVINMKKNITNDAKKNENSELNMMFETMNNKRKLFERKQKKA